VTTARVAPVAGFPAEVRDVSGPFLGVVRPDLAPDLLGERGERGVFELCDFGELVSQRVDDPIILCSNRLRIGLVKTKCSRVRSSLRGWLFGVGVVE
jgi:hypothetical protein